MKPVSIDDAPSAEISSCVRAFYPTTPLMLPPLIVFKSNELDLKILMQLTEEKLLKLISIHFLHPHDINEIY